MPFTLNIAQSGHYISWPAHQILPRPLNSRTNANICFIFPCYASKRGQENLSYVSVVLHKEAFEFLSADLLASASRTAAATLLRTLFTRVGHERLAECDDGPLLGYILPFFVGRFDCIRCLLKAPR